MTRAKIGSRNILTHVGIVFCFFYFKYKFLQFLHLSLVTASAAFVNTYCSLIGCLTDIGIEFKLIIPNTVAGTALIAELASYSGKCAGLFHHDVVQ